MGESLRIALAQLNLLVGDVQGNAARVIAATRHARSSLGADLVLFPELTLSGYPPEDLLFHRGFRRQIEEGLARLRRELTDAAVMVGFPEYTGGGIYNSAALIAHGEIAAIHRKAELPNYKVFDEKRYFQAGAQPTVADCLGFRVGLLVCEDIWQPEAAQLARADGAQLLLVINASPYEIHKQREREDMAGQRARDVGLPLAYVNLVGGQDELVFDGNSFVMDAHGEVLMRAPPFAEGTYLTPFVRDAHGEVTPQAGEIASRYTSDMSLADAREQAGLLGVKYSVLSIEGMFEATLATLKDEFAGRAPDATEENIQSRCRMLLLMGLSNKTGRMLLTTGNKSEMAVGYATLYGDMAGGFAPIKDCSKVLVYRLANYRNSLGRVIPQRVIERAPSAELRPGQKDSDSLPPYEVLDPILEAFIEEDLSVDEIEARGFDRATTAKVLDLVKRNEYKRRQAPPGVRVSRRAFGRDWRYPITSGYRR
ncbi:MAG: NAD(+) synthase [Gammaproteobacteria bacterium]|nr:MAG: NAD(+) synthase [Gammaproteobacteria bacterium]